MENRNYIWHLRFILAFIPAFILALTLTACSKHKGEVAAETAKAYYDQLIQGDYNAFVEGELKGDSVPTTYRKQLTLNAKMYMENQTRSHQGISSVEVVRGDYDSDAETANAFLNITYGDDTREEICVPMVEKDGTWYMR